MPPTHEPATDAVRERARRVTQGGDTAAGRETAGRVPSAPSRPSRGMPHTLVLRLQQQAGNAAVSRLVRPTERRGVPPEPAPAGPGSVVEELERVDGERPVAEAAEVGAPGSPADDLPIPGPEATGAVPGHAAGQTVATGRAAEPTSVGGASPGGAAEVATAGSATPETGTESAARVEGAADSSSGGAEGGATRAVPVQRPGPRPAPAAPRPAAAGTLEAGGPDRAVEAPAVETAPEAVAPGPAPSVDVAVGGSSGDGGGAPSPPPGLGDDDLAALDAEAPTGAAAAEVQTDHEPASEPAPAAGELAEADAARESDVEPVAGGGTADVAQEAAADEPEVDPSATPEAVASGAQAEVDQGSAPGPEPSEEGGGGGSGAVVEDRSVLPPPDVSAAPPERAMATVASLRPTQMAATLGGVEVAAGTAVARERSRLAATPPRHTPLAGATQAGAASDQVPAGGAAGTARVRPVEPGAARPTPPPRPLPTPAPAPVARVAPPPLPATPEGGLTEDSARNLAASIDRLPTRDPGAAVTPGPAPELQLAGDADPGQVSTQQARLAEGAAQAQTEGARDAAEPMGEDAVRPTVAVETIEADVAAGGGGGTAAAPALAAGGGGGGEGGPSDDIAVDAVAEEQQGPAIRSATAAGAAQMAAVRQQHADQEHAQRAQSAQQVAALEAQHAQAEAAQRAEVRTDVAGQRSAWRAEQGALVTGARAEAQAVTAAAGTTVASQRASARTEAAQAHADGQREAAQARQEGEQEAARARSEGRRESGGGGFFGWLASRATALFDRVKAGISAAFEKARQAVRAAVEKAQALATAVIEKARQAVVAAIRLAGSALTAIGDRLLAAFPAVRERFRTAIRAAVQRAEAAVNRLAEGLKAGVRAAIGLLGRALTAALNGLEAGLKVAVNAVAATVTAAINAARAALAGIGAFLAVARDVAANPGAWLRNLGAAVVDGIRNHLWKALKTAVQQWFDDKVEQVLGLGRAVWNLLTKGGISIARIGAMAWQGIKAAIPAALIGLLVEKLVSMIVPAAGAVLAIIQGLQAAWGTVGRILQAIDKFVTFLKAVKTGAGGPAFANVLAAAGVAVVDFVSNWLLARLARGASRVAGRIRQIAQRIGAALRRVARRVGGALRRVGRRIGDRLRGVRDRFRAWRDRRRGITPEERRRRDQADKQRRLDRAHASVRSALARGITGLRLRALLAVLKIRHRLGELRVEDQGADRARIIGAINPRFDEFAHKVPVVEPSSPERSKAAVRSFWRSMGFTELKRIHAGHGFSVQVSKGRGVGEPGLSDRSVYATHHIRKEGQQPDPEKYKYSVLVELELEESAMSDLMHGPHGMIARVTADQFVLQGRGVIVQKSIGGRARDVFVFHDKPEHLPQELPIHTSGQRNALVYKVERVNTPNGPEAAENYLVISRAPDDPDALVHALNARIVRISVTGGVGGQVTEGLVRTILGGGGGGGGDAG